MSLNMPVAGWLLLALSGLILAVVAKVVSWLMTPHCSMCGASMPWNEAEHTDVCLKCYNKAIWEEYMNELEIDFPMLRCGRCGEELWSGLEEAEGLCDRCMAELRWLE